MGIIREEIIGSCRLILGDCLEVMPLLEDNSIKMIWTDPPYGHSNHDGDLNSSLNAKRGLESAPIANDGADSMRIVVDGMLKEASRILTDNSCCCCCCCCGGGGPKPTFAWLAERMDRDGMQFFHSVIWDKKNPGLGWRYRRQHEMVMVAHKKDGKLAWANDEVTQRNIIDIMPNRERFHPNEKPVELVKKFIALHTKEEDIVLDPFMGSASTGVACVALGRKFIGIELDEKYFDIACRRVEEAYKQPDLFIQPPVKQEQQSLL